MSIIKTLITHYADACRYVDCGWSIVDLKIVELNGKPYQEATLVWDSKNGDTPIYPHGEAPPISPD